MPDRTGPFNLQASVTTEFSPPPITGNQYKAVAVYNSTPDQCQVDYGTNTDVLEPNMANIYYLPAPNYSIRVTPIDTVASGTYIGTVSVVWYRPNEIIPTFPLPLASFPGGSSITYAQKLIFGGVLPGTFGFNFAFKPPAGTASCSLNFSFFNFASWDALIMPNLTVKGVQSSTSYVSDSETGGGPTSVTFATALATDSTYQLATIFNTANPNSAVQFQLLSSPT